MTNCRVSDDLTTYLEAEAEREMAQWDSEVEETETCDVCQQVWPATELPLEGICESCVSVGVMYSDSLFVSAEGELYAL